MIKTFLYRRLLKRFITNGCESCIPRTGKKGEEVNCYIVAIDHGDLPYFVATEINGDILTGLKWNENSYSISATISISELDSGTLNITHFYGLSEVTYDSILTAALHYVTRINYLKIHILRHIDSTYQYYFNKRKLNTKKQMELLRLMVDAQLDRNHDGITLLNLMILIYSMRLFLHPSRELQQRKINLYLESLVLSGDIKKIGFEYVVTGQAINTLEKYEEDEKRDTEALKLQKGMFYLTLVIAISALVQSGVIKLPTVIDFSGP